MMEKKLYSRATEIIRNDPGSDIFMLPGYLYQKSDNQDVDMTPDVFIGKISKMYANDAKFSAYMASTLPIGTNVYRSKTVGYVLAQTEHGYLFYKDISLE